MKNYYHLLNDVTLFNGIEEESFSEMLSYLDAYEKTYEKNDPILNAGDPVVNVGIVLDGLIHIVKEDINGNRAIVSEFGKNHIFAEAFCCARLEKMPVSVISASKSSIFFVNYGKIMKECGGKRHFHHKLIENMLMIMAKKNLVLNQKIEYVSKRTTREKLMAYLSRCATESQSRIFEIPFNRQELSDFLFIDRSAMSKELSRLKEEGIIDYYKNQFKLL